MTEIAAGQKMSEVVSYDTDGMRAMKQGTYPDCGQKKALVWWPICKQWICKTCLRAVREATRNARESNDNHFELVE